MIKHYSFNKIINYAIIIIGDNMKEDLKTILYMGIGAISETNEKLKDVSDSLYAKGKELYEKGLIANEELKHNINEMMREKNINVTPRKEDILKDLNNLSEKDKKDIMNKMGWTDAKHGKGEQQ